MSSLVTREEMEHIREWLRTNLLSKERLPYSFKLDGVPFSEFAARSEFSCLQQDEDYFCRYTTCLADPVTGLEARCLIWADREFPLVKWTVWLENKGSRTTGQITDFYGADALLFPYDVPGYMAQGIIPTLHHFKGDCCYADAYMPQTETFYPGETLTYRSYGGRPTNGLFPYYRMDDGQKSLIFVVSWQGQWEIRFEGRDDGAYIRAGQQHLDTCLHPGESIRAPQILVMPLGSADGVRAQNLWRRFFLSHHLVKAGAPYIHSSCYAGRMYEEMVKADEEKLVAYADRFLSHDIHLDYLWVDAGWYDLNGQHVWMNTGTWKPDTRRFPRGLRGLSDKMHKRGMKMIVWFEPERVTLGSELYEQHPEWCLHCSKSADNSGINELLYHMLLDLSNPDAVAWLTERVCGLIRSEGIDLYRQDFNFEPLPYWRENDRPGRTGFLENRYCVGYLQFWDNILAAFPGIIIDSCASGGRRNDLETMERSIPMHPTDYNYGDLTAKQGMHHTLYQWFPFFGTMNLPCDQKDIYYHRSAIAALYRSADDVRDEGFDFALFKRWLDEWEETKAAHLGDFYPLTPYSIDERDWLAWELYNEDAGRGLVLVFMREGSPVEKAVYPLYGLEEDAVYTVKNYNTGEQTAATGRLLMRDGVEAVRSRRPDSLLLGLFRN